MPYTVNGIGTKYYGKKNRSVRGAVCKSCHRAGDLESYDTRLFVVLAFIPVVPLGRKRIIDLCPACSRHYVMKADAYEQARQLQTSGSLEQYRRSPSVDAAVEAHGQLLAFHEHEQAAEFRSSALARFPDHAGLRASLAEQLLEASEFDQAAALFADAFRLAPDLPEARAGSARGRMAEGRLDEAEELLDFLMEPGAGQVHPLGPLDTLAGSYQRAGRHEEAVRIAAVLQRELPGLADDHTFRAFVKRSEKALGRTESTLARRPFTPTALFRSEGSPYAPWQRATAIGAVGAALVLAGLAVNNEYIRRHRTLHVLNAAGAPATVQIDDGPAETVVDHGRLTVAEGPHVVNVSGPVEATYQVGLSSGYFDRWFSQPAWIVDLGGEAVVEDATHVYSDSRIPSSRRLLVGETFISRPHVDYLFTSAPNQIEISSKNATVEKTEIGWGRVGDLDAFKETIGTNRAAALDFAERRLRRRPDQSELLSDYARRVAENEADRARGEAFLRSGLDRLPVDVGWHRKYQSIAEMNGRSNELIAMYDGRLAAEPSSAPLLYLRGRVEPDWEAQETYCKRAIAADPKLGWPWMGLSSLAGAEADWDESLAAALKARELKSADPEIVDRRIHEARIARGEAGTLVEEYRAEVVAKPFDFMTLGRLLDALAASGDAEGVGKEAASWTSRLPAEAQGQLVSLVKPMGSYYAGDLEGCVSDPTARTSPFRLHALAALGRTKEAAEDPALEPLRAAPLSRLVLCVGFGLDGDAQAAAHWRTEAAAALGKADPSVHGVGRGAALLEADKAPSTAEARRFYAPHPYKALILAALAERHPDDRARLLAEAARYNVERGPSYHLVKRAVDVEARGDARP